MNVQTDLKAGFLSINLGLKLELDIDLGGCGCGDHHSKYRKHSC
jgi:hypothetical protein